MRRQWLTGGPEIQKQFSGLFALRKVGTPVIDTKVVVIPGGQDGRLVAQLSKQGLCGQGRVLRCHHSHVLGVTVDVVSQKDEHLRVV